MKFGQFMSYQKKKKKLSTNSTKTAAWKLVSGPFQFAQKYAQPLGKWNFWSKLAILDTY